MCCASTNKISFSIFSHLCVILIYLTQHSNQYSMDSIIDIDEPPIFRREEWIGKKKEYSHQNLPLFMINACDTAFAIPPNEMARSPDCNIAVSDLLRLIRVCYKRHINLLFSSPPSVRGIPMLWQLVEIVTATAQVVMMDMILIMSLTQMIVLMMLLSFRNLWTR